ncbi:rhamnogalacturonan acetylesterase [Arthrobacter sp. NPDC057388]|uniref:rhamnogalacturonan acetylesterase n=1 Tax=Arthrobacter sp. NPDC057388 TaxID=3346116 RepID=UPI0036343403
MADKQAISRRTALIALGAASLSVAAAPAYAESLAHPVDRTFYIAGDSTSCQKHEDVAPETGWGMGMPFFLNPRVRTDNRALSGRSSKSFIDEGHLEAILADIKSGDILLVQFGHNDQKLEDPKRYTEPWTTYQDHLRLYVDGARSRGAVPVLATPAERRRFERSGNAYSSHGDYPAAMRALAAEKGVPLIDVQAQTLALWQQLGPEETKKYFLYVGDRRDNTHFNTPGAAAIAKIISRGLLDTSVLEPGHLRRLDEEIDTSWFRWPAGITPPPAPL